MVDLTKNSSPALGYNNIYSGTIYAQEAMSLISNHNASEPLMLYLAWQINHTPLQVPSEYLARFKHINDTRRQTYAAMTNFVDDGVLNVTRALRDKGMWENTIFVFSSDNGGPAGSANNWPLRGFKFSDLEAEPS